jgi:hypothetical protein
VDRALRSCTTAFVALLALALVPASPAAAANSGQAPSAARARVVLALLPVPVPPPAGSAAASLFTPTNVLDILSPRRQLALGLLGATQGRYNNVQALLDMGQGTRVSAATYLDLDPPDYMAFYPIGRRGLINGWLDELDRADAAPADVVPGLLGSRVPGGTGYAGVTGRDQLDAIPAANRRGRIGAVSIGPSSTLARRVGQLLRRRRFVVAGLPEGARGGRVLDQLLRGRDRNELVIAMQEPPPLRAPQLLPIGIAGLGRPRALTSISTHLAGVVAGIDIAPTVLRWLHRPIPAAMKGEPIQLTGDRDEQALMRLAGRLKVVDGRRFPVLETVLGVWLAVVLALAAIFDRRGTRRGLRIGALAMLWLPSLLLATAALQPSRGAEVAYLVVGAFVLAAITDVLVPWPRAPIIPAGAATIGYIVDLAFHSHLIVRSILGPNPRFGSRYYGIGNELEALLPVVMFIGIAALLGARPRSRGAAAVFAVCGLVLGVAFGSARLGADVGGVITVGVGAAVATLLMLPGRIGWKGVAIVVVTPVVALAALAGLDLATGGNGHFTRTVLHANGEGALTDIVVRRYQLAFNVFGRGLMPYATAIAVLALAYGIRFRGRLLAPLQGAPAWNAALWGAIASGVAGSLGNDSGPELLVIATVVIAVALAYVRGDPRLGATPVSNPIHPGGASR